MLKHLAIGAAAIALAGCGGGPAGTNAVAGVANGQVPTGGNQAANNMAGADAALAPLPWPAFYERAGQVFQAGQRDEAVRLFYIGQLRGRIAVQCKDLPPDGEPALLASLNATLGQTINEYAGGSPEGWAAAIDAALAFDAAHPDPNAASARCRTERDSQRAGLTQLRDRIRSSPDEIRAQRTANGLPNR